MTINYFKSVYYTYIENWSADLIELTIPQTDIPLTLEEARALGLANKEYASWFGTGIVEFVGVIEKYIDTALLDYPGGAFVRLGSRSGKDSRFADTYGLKITDGHSAIRMLTEDSYRIACDLRLALHNDYLPHIFVRKWFEILAWSEFRCFMKNRELAGISQYDCLNLGHCSEIEQNAVSIEVGIRDFFKIFKTASHLDDVVFDVFVYHVRLDTNKIFKVQLLELNPFFFQTDPCLFNWTNGGDFDGTFRYL